MRRFISKSTGLLAIMTLLFTQHVFAQIKTHSKTTLIEGDGFKLESFTYENGQGEVKTTELFYIHSAQGVENAYLQGGLPLEEKLELEQEIAEDVGEWKNNQSASSVADGDFETTDTNRLGADSYDVWVIDKTAANLTNEAQAQAYAEAMGITPDVDKELRELHGADPYTYKSINGEVNYELLGLRGCFGWKNKSKDFNKRLDKTYNLDKTIGGSSANIVVKADIDVDTTINTKVGYKYKRKFCIPYKFRLKQVDAQSNYDVSGSLSLIGTAQKTFSDQKWKIAEPQIVSTLFFVGPIPVLIKVRVPIEIGTGDIILKAVGEVKTVKPLRFYGNFHYICTTQRCVKQSASHTNAGDSLSNSLGAAVSASVDLDPYVHVGARGIVYGEWFFYMQVGIKPSFPIQLYGYYGNLCGDGNADGTRETVYAGLGTIGFKVGITAESKIFGRYLLRDKYWKIWQTGLLFKDFVNPYSTALSPELAPSYDSFDTSVSLPVKVRSCVRNQVQYYPRDYRVHWGDGTSSSVNNITTQGNTSHTYSQPGIYTVRVVDEGGASTEVNILLNGDEW